MNWVEARLHTMDMELLHQLQSNNLNFKYFSGKMQPTIHVLNVFSDIWLQKQNVSLYLLHIFMK